METAFERIKRLVLEHAVSHHFIHLKRLYDAELIRNRIYLLQRMSENANQCTREELNNLTPAQLKDLASLYREYSTSSIYSPVKTSTELLQKFTDSAFSEYELRRDKPVVSTDAATQVTPAGTGDSSPTGSMVNGVALRADEYWAERRYFNKQEGRYGELIIKKGIYTLTAEQLSPDEQATFVLNVASQFLMNHPASQQATIKGPGPLGHPLYAAFLYLQRSLGPSFKNQWPEFNITLPDGMAVVEEDAQEAYIKEHLGDILGDKAAQPLSEFLSVLAQEQINPPVPPEDVIPNDSPPVPLHQRIDLNQCLAQAKTDVEQGRIKRLQKALASYETFHEEGLKGFIAAQHRVLINTAALMSQFKINEQFAKEYQVLSEFYEHSHKQHGALVLQWNFVKAAHPAATGQQEAVNGAHNKLSAMDVAHFLGAILQQSEHQAVHGPVSAPILNKLTALLHTAEERFEDEGYLQEIRSLAQQAVDLIAQHQLATAEQQQLIDSLRERHKQIMQQPESAAAPQAKVIQFKDQLQVLKAQGAAKEIQLTPEEAGTVKQLVDAISIILEDIDSEEQTFQKLSESLILLNEKTITTDSIEHMQKHWGEVAEQLKQHPEINSQIQSLITLLHSKHEPAVNPQEEIQSFSPGV